MKAAAMKAQLIAFFDIVWNSGQVDSLERFVAPAYTIRSDPGDHWDGATLTRKEFAERVRLSRAPFPDQRFEIADILVDGARIVADWRWRGTHLDALPGFPASGRSVKTSGLTIYDFEDGLLRGHRQQTDRLAVLQQLSAKT